MSGTQKPIAVVLGNAATGLYVARELGRAGIRVRGISRRRECGGASKYLSDYVICPTAEETIDVLLRLFGQDQAKPILFPASDHYIEFIADNAGLLAERFSFQNSYANGLAQALVTKSYLYKACSEHDVVLPAWRNVTRSSLVSISDALQFPIFVKPDQIHHVKHAMKGQKGWIVNGRADLERLSASLPGGDHTFVAQEIVPGPESEILLYCAYFDAQGQPRQAFTGRKLRQYPPGFGSASLVVSEICEEAREISERFLAAIGYQGIAACEFKRDPRDKKLKLIEINPRPSLWFSLANAADKTVMLAAYHDLGGTGVPLPEGDQKTAVGWRYLNRDVYSAYFYSRAQDFLLPKPDVGAYWAAGKRVDAVYCQDDPWPAASEWRSSVGGMIGRLSGAGGADD